MNKRLVLSLLTAFCLACLPVPSPAQHHPPTMRQAAAQALRDGNYLDAFELYKKVILDEAAPAKWLEYDLAEAIGCLRRLNRDNEQDDFIESVIARQSGKWSLLSAAARIYNRDLPHSGYIIAGKFQRGHHRGGVGKYVNSIKRDRARALQLMLSAMPLVQQEDNKEILAGFYLDLAGMLLSPQGNEQYWMLQHLTDLSRLPDYEEGYHYGGGRNRGVPVNAKGEPLYYYVPSTWETAKNDGERWRWCLNEAKTVWAKAARRADYELARLLHNNLGVQTLAFQPIKLSKESKRVGKESGTYALHTLSEDETIARLASGAKRFELPEEFNFVSIYKTLAASDSSDTYASQALDALASIFENRRQYPRAAYFWQESIKRFPQNSKNRKERLNQIVGAWGRIENVIPMAAGQKASFNYRFRNGSSVRFEAHKIHINKFIDDIIDYLKSNPRRVDFDKIHIANIGYQLIDSHSSKYLGQKTASWQASLKPRENHFDEVITVETPLDKPGAYFLTAEIAGGNTSRTIVWLHDTVIVQKNMGKQTFYYAADALSGKPLPDMELRFFGYLAKRTEDSLLNTLKLGREYNIETAELNLQSDSHGQAIATLPDSSPPYDWLVVARNKAGRLAFLGFAPVWSREYKEAAYSQVKTFVITDRPVYRPAQPVKFKVWINRASYETQPHSPEYANRIFKVEIRNPRGEEVFNQEYKSDEFGGLNGEFTPPADSQLGVYSIAVPALRGRGGTFRIEEYKKPEFEVLVEAPPEPVALGDVIKARVKARYYFGAPVINATVRYKVLRYAHDQVWYPPGEWDWLYGRGYGWAAYDYEWYPGWSSWGCRAPFPWWQSRSRTPPELVQENEVQIGADGTIEISIDTAAAKELFGAEDQRYEISAEVTDQSRRTIFGSGEVIAAKQPFRVMVSVNKGYYSSGETIKASFSAYTADNKPVEGAGLARLFSITYGKTNQPQEKEVQKWKLDTASNGRSELIFKAAKPGQYRLTYTLTSQKKQSIEGAYIFSVRGSAGADEKNFRFNPLELVPDKPEYSPGQRVKLLVNSDHREAHVLLFSRPGGGVYSAPQVFELNGKSLVHEISVHKGDMPNFFVEALTVFNGQVFEEVREIAVPPEKKVLNIALNPSAEEFKPGEKGKLRILLKDPSGKPAAGSLAVAVYDQALEYISSGSNVPDIKSFFWQWRRSHRPQSRHSLQWFFMEYLKPNEQSLQNLGLFGEGAVDEVRSKGLHRQVLGGSFGLFEGRMKGDVQAASLAAKDAGAPIMQALSEEAAGAPEAEAAPAAQLMIRKEFADTALWIAGLKTGADGLAEVELKMPENLTSWRVKAWAMGDEVKVGEAQTQIITSKKLLLRMQAPRFFVEKDEVILSANIHNYLPKEASVQAELELEGEGLAPLDGLSRKVTIKANGEERVDWRVKALKEGEVIVRMKALSASESDAMQVPFPVQVHGMLKSEAQSAALAAGKTEHTFSINIPAERRPGQTRLEVRYSPSLALAMVDALPYLVSYPYDCTEQTLSRFLPTVITQRVLLSMGLDLNAIKNERVNLNAQELGDDDERRKQWQRYSHNPVFDAQTVKEMASQGITRLFNMQLSDGGWGWFSGRGEYSSAHITAYIVHGLLTAKANDLDVPSSMLERGVNWLKHYQAAEVQKLRNAASEIEPWKTRADELDAFVLMVLRSSNHFNQEMVKFLYRDKNDLGLYAKALLALALEGEKEREKAFNLLKNIEQHLVKDEENQTAYLNLNNASYWWYWYGSEYEAHAYYLKLLMRLEPQSPVAPALVKYLLNNRKHATHWNSTRDTAIVMEAFAEYLKTSREGEPNLTVSIYVDGKKQKETRINKNNLFTFDNKLVLEGDALSTGQHRVEIRKSGAGALYLNAYLATFTLEDFIRGAGLELKVKRTYYRLTPSKKTVPVQAADGQLLEQPVEKYERVVLENDGVLKSGDLVEVELEIDSKNDYEYLVFEDMKPAGFEPLEVRSGYNPNDLNAYMELRDNRTAFFVQRLSRGKHSLAYRMKAEIPGRFSALPARAYAMYAPELKANSDELKVAVED